MKTYHELMTLSTFEDRFHYLQRDGIVGHPTFGSERWMNQRFYMSSEWKQVRDIVISRDEGFDLGCHDYPISGRIMVHHIESLTPDIIRHSDRLLLDPDNLISCSIMTHNAIHYGGEIPGPKIIDRRPGDTKLW